MTVGKEILVLHLGNLRPSEIHKVSSLATVSWQSIATGVSPGLLLFLLLLLREVVPDAVHHGVEVGPGGGDDGHEAADVVFRGGALSAGFFIYAELLEVMISELQHGVPELSPGETPMGGLSSVVLVLHAHVGHSLEHELGSLILGGGGSENCCEQHRAGKGFQHCVLIILITIEVYRFAVKLIRFVK